jgi:hypothetical protein
MRNEPSSGWSVYSSGFMMMESRMAMAVSARKRVPNIERGVLKMGCPWRTRFEGRASA